MVREYVPDWGHCIWMEFSPQSGHEQAGRRPALVLSPASYNRLSGLALMCPITNRAKGYPFEVRLPENIPVAGVVLSDQLKSADWRTRNGKFIAVAPDSVLAEVRGRIGVLLGLQVVLTGVIWAAHFPSGGQYAPPPFAPSPRHCLVGDSRINARQNQNHNQNQLRS